MSFDQPLVVTLALDAHSQRWFETERTRWFPPGRTLVGAHVTLFHAIPGALTDQVQADLAQVAGPAFDVAVTGVRSLGRGAAYVLAAPELDERHRDLQRRWWPHLTRQDQQGFRGHVTVQNKVDRDTARATVDALRGSFRPFVARAEGFVLWRYEGGPWTALARVPFG